MPNQVIQDLDRPEITRDFEPWGRPVTFRKISAAQLLALNDQFGHLDGEDVLSERAVDFYATLLAMSLVDPAETADHWKTSATADTITALGMIALEVNNLVGRDAKKN